MTNKYFISGWVLSQEKHLTGIPRCALQWIIGIDKALDNYPNLEVYYVCPAGAQHYLFNPKQFKNIKFIEISSVKRKLRWKFHDFPSLVKKHKGTALFFNPEPTNCKDFIVFLPDVRPLLYKTDSFLFRLVFRCELKSIARNAKIILTDSLCEKNNIARFIKPKAVIEVVYPGWEHISSIREMKPSVIDEKFKDNGYYFTLGSFAPHKNINWIVECAKYNQDDFFIISGSNNPKLWKQTSFDKPSNVIFTGHISDENIKYLFKHAKAYIHPAYYEGFGLPPLEALSLSSRVVLSNIKVLALIPLRFTVLKISSVPSSLNPCLLFSPS